MNTSADGNDTRADPTPLNDARRETVDPRKTGKEAGPRRSARSGVPSPGIGQGVERGRLVGDPARWNARAFRRRWPRRVAAIAGQLAFTEKMNYEKKMLYIQTQ